MDAARARRRGDRIASAEGRVSRTPPALTDNQKSRSPLGTVAGATGLLIRTGFDKPLESFLVAVSPLWLTRLTTSL